MTRTVTSTLAQLLSSHFSASAREKGNRYFNNAVTQFVGDSHAAKAMVQGTDYYRVALRFEEGANVLRGYCDCQAFENTGACKHIWAVIKTADARGPLSAARAKQCEVLLPVWPEEADDYFGEVMEFDEPEAFDELDGFDDDEFDLIDGPDSGSNRDHHTKLISEMLPVVFRGSMPPPPSNPARNRTAREPESALWKSALASVVRQPAAEHKSFWSNGRRVIYIIDIGQSLRFGSGPTIEIAFQDRKTNGEWSKPRNLRITQFDIEAAPNALDRKALETLRGLRAANYGFSSYYRDPHDLGSTVALNEGVMSYLVPMLCETGRCCLRIEDRYDAELMRIDWHDSLWRLEIRVNETDGGNYALTGLLRRDMTYLADHFAQPSANEPSAENEPGVQGQAESNGEPADIDLLPLSAPHLLLRGGVMFVGEEAAFFDDGGQFEWITMLRRHGQIIVPRSDGPLLAETLLTMPRQVPIGLPNDLAIPEEQATPKPRLRLIKGERYGRPVDDCMHASLQFDYEGKTIAWDDPAASFVVDEPRRLIYRDHQAEAAALDLLPALHFRELGDRRVNTRQFEIKVKKLHAALPPLVAAGWRVEAEGKPYRSAGAVDIKVTSGIDWFELTGQAHFDDQVIELPQLLAALRRQENTIVLGDGTIGMLPQEWLKRYGSLAALGTEQDDHIRFKQTQVGLLDALLAAMPEATCDAVFEKARKRLREFDGVKPADAPHGFGGELRPYQREGLGWLQFLREFRFGGCLADDMGLGKTIQVLAMLEARRLEKEAARLEAQERQTQQQKAQQQQTEDNALPAGKKGKGRKPSAKQATSRKAAAPEPVATASLNGDGDATPATAPALSPRPSLVVLPRSLVFNWMNEAAKFTPNLRVLDHSGIDRICRGQGDHTAQLGEYDLILTTYGTVRTDAAKLKDVKFDYVILDEAQAVKNANTASAKAVRLLDGGHRLVMTGTPVENRLGDLWSLFEFLNPGMLGSAGVFRLLGGANDNAGDEARQLLGRAMRPFILRRKKDQVARDLPARIEQTIYCELEPKQRKLYNQLREHYRQSLLSKVAQVGMNKAKMHVLEALLRLRQAACHPGLIDKAMMNEPSAKLDALMPQLQELIDEGHKVLVFSQFTSLLSIVRQRLDAEKVVYEYLDGKTRDRQARVDRFQNDPDCHLFLISLKAGGVGLNLTAAEHVFLLDPWWNPAVEAQAIDRAHRIGQTKQVFAFRLITRDTVEEKVLELQNSKRELADAIINQDNSLITKLGREELELLLS